MTANACHPSSPRAASVSRVMDCATLSVTARYSHRLTALLLVSGGGREHELDRQMNLRVARALAHGAHPLYRGTLRNESPAGRRECAAHMLSFASCDRGG